jgi:hypothetical protein
MTWDQVLVWIVVPLVGSILIGGGAVWLSRRIPWPPAGEAAERWLPWRFRYARFRGALPRICSIAPRITW